MKGVFKGAGFGHRKVVQIFDAQLFALVVQPIQVFIPVIGGFDNVMVENQVIAGSVAYQNLAVPIQNIASGCTDGGDG